MTEKPLTEDGRYLATIAPSKRWGETVRLLNAKVDTAKLVGRENNRLRRELDLAYAFLTELGKKYPIVSKEVARFHLKRLEAKVRWNK